MYPLTNQRLLKRVLLLTLVLPLLSISQVTIRERIELKQVAKTQAASRLVRFVFTCENQIYLRMYINGGQYFADGRGSAEFSTYADQCSNFSFNLQARLAEIWDPYVGVAVTFDIYVDGVLVRHDVGRITGGAWTIFGIWQDELYNDFTVPNANKIVISAELALSTLPALGDNDNKDNPYWGQPDPDQPSGIDKRKKVIDPAKAKSTKLTIRIKDEFGVPMANVAFWMTSSRIDFSGGHDHTALYEWEPVRGAFVKDGHPMEYYYGVTDQNGEDICFYRCTGIGGKDLIEFHVQDPCYIGVRDGTATVDVKIPQLEKLEAGEYYTLIGMYGTGDVKSKHYENHYGTPKLVRALKDLAGIIYAGTDYERLQINDMSLVLGGPFDITNNFDTPHQNHRNGLNVDLRMSLLTQSGTTKSLSEDELNEFVSLLDQDKLKILTEGDPAHYHVTVW